MKPANFSVRRATFDDIPSLQALWRTMQFPAEELSRKLTDFQVVTDNHGGLIGAIGMEISGKQGRIHSEAFVDFSWAETFRPMLWERLLALAKNHNLCRLWTREQAPFYRQLEMTRPDQEELKALPKEWALGAGDWLTIKLRDDLDTIIKADKEFALFMAAEKERTQRTLARSKALRVIATIFAFIVAALVLGGLLYLMQRSTTFRR